jgi:hypothetical protein
LSRSCGGFRKLGFRKIHVGFPDALRYSLAAHFHQFSQEFVLIGRNPNKALIFWTNHILVPRLDMIADLVGIWKAAGCPPSLSSEGRTGCRLNSSG